MIFISSQLPLEELHSKTLEEICNTADWFLFDSLIRSKKYWRDENFYKMYNRLFWYPIFYKERIYNYLMSDNYYLNNHLYKIMRNHAQIICMKKVKELEEIQNFGKEVIRREERLFGERDIRDMFDFFEKNNLRENPVCEYVLG